MSLEEPCEVLVTGVFACLHAGHIELLEYAATLGVVTVGINGEAYVLNKLGTGAPSIEQRVYTLLSCRHVSRVVVFHEPDPSELIRTLKPKYLVKGPDYAGKEVVEGIACDEVDAKLVISPGGKILHSSVILGIRPPELPVQQTD